MYSYSFQTRQNCLICRLLFIIIDTKNSNCMQGSLNKTLQAQFTSVFIVLIDVWLFLNILNYTNPRWPSPGFILCFMSVVSRAPNRFLWTRDLPYLKLGIRDLKPKSGRVSGLKVCVGGGMPKITSGLRDCTEFWVGITGLKKTLLGTLRFHGRAINWGTFTWNQVT